jgi:uncharacterized C2H2 Zn-finger protein
VQGYIDENGLFCLKCPYCGKVVKSKWVRQAIFNFETHVTYCKKRPKYAEAEEAKEQ